MEGRFLTFVVMNDHKNHAFFMTCSAMLFGAGS
jgi:hypothetical protein